MGFDCKSENIEMRVHNSLRRYHTRSWVTDLIGRDGEGKGERQVSKEEDDKLRWVSMRSR